MTSMVVIKFQAASEANSRNSKMKYSKTVRLGLTTSSSSGRRLLYSKKAGTVATIPTDLASLSLETGSHKRHRDSSIKRM